MIKKTCIRCHKTYEVYPVRKNSQYCSFDCYKRNLTIKKICKICNKQFEVIPSWKMAKFCSRKCYAIYRIGKKRPPFSEDAKRKISIANKNKVGYWRGKKRPSFSMECRKKMSLSQLGDKNHRWKGGRHEDGHGYILIYSPNHPHKIEKNYIYEHRLIMEKHLGRYLDPKEVVHHINEIKDDNRIENLMLFANASDHIKYHFSS